MRCTGAAVPKPPGRATSTAPAGVNEAPSAPRSAIASLPLRGLTLHVYPRLRGRIQLVLDSVMVGNLAA